jgi:hypothetical protein
VAATVALVEVALAQEVETVILVRMFPQVAAVEQIGMVADSQVAVVEAELTLEILPELEIVLQLLPHKVIQAALLLAQLVHIAPLVAAVAPAALESMETHLEPVTAAQESAMQVLAECTAAAAAVVYILLLCGAGLEKAAGDTVHQVALQEDQLVLTLVEEVAVKVIHLMHLAELAVVV